MNIQSYKLPTNWQIKPIEEVYRFTKKPKGLHIEDYSEIPFIPMELLPLGKIMATDWVMRETKNLGSGTYFENGDLLVAKITPSFENGKQAIARINVPFGYATTEVIPIQEIAGMSDKFYLHFILLHPEIRRELADKMDGSTGRQRLRKEILASKKIPFPPLPEQRRIVRILSTVQTAIEQQSRLIALTRELKSALMHKLFTEGLRGEKQKQTEIGLMPESWEVVNIKEAVEYIDYGYSAPIPKTKPENGLKIVSTADINRAGELLYWKIRRTVAPEITVKRLTLQDGDVLFNWRNSAELIGKTTIYEKQPETHIFASFVLRIRCDEMKTHNYFLKHLLNYYREKEVFVKLSRRAVNQSNYNRNEIFELKIPFPKFEEQYKIAKTIGAIESKIHLHESKKNLLEELFRTLLHQLMTGQIRVNEIDLPGLS